MLSVIQVTPGFISMKRTTIITRTSSFSSINNHLLGFINNKEQTTSGVSMKSATKKVLTFNQVYLLATF